MKILAAIPCYNEGLAIGSVVLKASRYVDAVLVVDDGSTDDTAEVAQEAGAIVVSHETNTGYGAALRSCFEYAKENKVDIMVILDGDGQHDPSSIPQFVKALTANGTDIVIGSRFLEKDNNNNKKNKKNNPIPKYRILGMEVLNLATNIAGNLKTSDSQSGFRAYSRKAIENISVTNLGMSAGSEILTQLKDLNLNVVEIPITTRYDVKNGSSKHPVSHGFGVLGSIIRNVSEKRPLLYIGVPGFLTSLIGVFFGIQLLHVYNQSGYFSIAYAMLVAIFMILGVIMILMGLMLNVMARLKRGEEKDVRTVR